MMTRTLATNNFKPGDRVTCTGIGIGYVREILEDKFGYYIYWVNLKKCGGGYSDNDLLAGWVRV